MEKESIDKKIKIDFADQEVATEETIRAGDVFGTFRVVTAAPTGRPKKFIDQVVVYTNGATLRLYWFDTKASVWHYVTATA